MLFATLDPVLRKIKLGAGLEVILSDTVGFISNLPHELVMAFRSTLEEVLEADLVVHVRDVSNTDSETQRVDVLDVLHRLGLKNIENEDNYIEVLNKTDLLSDEEKQAFKAKVGRNDKKLVAISALTGEGCAALLKLVGEKLTAGQETMRLRISAADGKTLALIYAYADVMEKIEKDDWIELCFKASQKTLQKLKKMIALKG
jgi:GTP-binding protein HflX